MHPELPGSHRLHGRLDRPRKAGRMGACGSLQFSKPPSLPQRQGDCRAAAEEPSRASGRGRAATTAAPQALQECTQVPAMTAVRARSVAEDRARWIPVGAGRQAGRKTLARVCLELELPTDGRVAELVGESSNAGSSRELPAVAPAPARAGGRLSKSAGASSESGSSQAGRRRFGLASPHRRPALQSPRETTARSPQNPPKPSSTRR